MLTALVDGDPIVYICGFAAQSSTWRCVEDDSIHATKTKAREHAENNKLNTALISEIIDYEPLSHALHLVKNCLNLIQSRTGCSEMRIFLTGSANFRDKIATIRPYKGNRPDRKPYWYKEIRDYLIEVRGAEVVNGIEADDALGIFSEGNKTVICTIDKDLDMIEGLHFNYQKDEMYDVSPENALRNFYMQLLTGDVTDNIQGVPGVGKKTARALLKHCTDEEDMYWTCLKEYCRTHEKAFEALLENARLLWMLREPKQQWEPPV